MCKDCASFVADVVTIHSMVFVLGLPLEGLADFTLGGFFKVGTVSFALFSVPISDVLVFLFLSRSSVANLNSFTVVVFGLVGLIFGIPDTMDDELSTFLFTGFALNPCVTVALNPCVTVALNPGTDGAGILMEE